MTLNPGTRNTAYMSFDGRNHQELREGDRSDNLKIKKPSFFCQTGGGGNLFLKKTNVLHLSTLVVETVIRCRQSTVDTVKKLTKVPRVKDQLTFIDFIYARNPTSPFFKWKLFIFSTACAWPLPSTPFLRSAPRTRSLTGSPPWRSASTGTSGRSRSTLTSSPTSQGTEL